MSALAEDPALPALPAALTGLVGRREEQRRLGELLERCRLLTLAGTGGCGKTRLALAVAEQEQAAFDGGVWWVDLSGVSADELVGPAVAAGLGLAPPPGEEPAAAVAGHLQQWRALIVLDNCEQVAVGCAALIDLLLRRCRRLTVLATSRELIGVPGEQVFRLGGLELAGEPGDARCEAVQLFVARASEAVPGFELSAEAGALVRRLCARLDGLPLAIELAAARVGMLDVGEIAERLDQGTGLLRHPSRVAPPRQQTLSATLDWSHDLLGAAEQVLFRRLAVFRGPFSLLAAETVASGEPLARREVLDLLGGLVNKSLLQVADRGREHRYRMLETVRQYGEQRLAESGEELVFEGAHADFRLELALQAGAGLDGPDQARWLGRLEIEHDNLRAALERSLPGRPETGCHLAAALWPFWYRRGHYEEGRSWLERAADVAATTSRPVRAATFTGAGVLAFFQCDYALAEERLTAARSLYEQESDRLGLATVLQRLGSLAREEGRYGEARRLHEESRSLFQELGDESGVAASEDYLGFVAWLEGDAAAALRLCGGAVGRLRRLGRRQETAAALVNLGVATALAGDPQAGEACLRESLQLSEELGYPEGEAWSLHELAVLLAGREPAAARRMLGRSLRLHHGLGDRWRVASVLEASASLLLAGSDPPLAAALFSAAAALRERLGAPRPPAEEATCAEMLALLASAPAGGALDEGRRLGLDLDLEDAVELTVQALEVPPGGPRAPGEQRYGLTGRELAVLGLLASGLTNREIGAALFISAGTAGVHVSNILRKLGVTGRVQAAGIAHELGLGPA